MGAPGGGHRGAERHRLLRVPRLRVGGHHGGGLLPQHRQGGGVVGNGFVSQEKRPTWVWVKIKPPGIGPQV